MRRWRSFILNPPSSGGHPPANFSLFGRRIRPPHNSSVIATGQWSEALGLSQPTRGSL
jgi:hypothetical protein